MKEFLLFALILLSGMWAVPSRASSGLSAQDYFEIQQLYAHYNIAIDSGDAEGYAATFTPNGVFNTYAGHDALVGFVKAWRGRMGGIARKHWNTNLEITGTSKEATGSVYLMLLDFTTKPVSIAATATYSDTLVKTKAGWRFATRTTKGDSVPAASSPDAPETAPAKP
jgi:hypothetical protein